LRRGGRGYSEETIPSRYLDDIPPELLSGKSRGGQSFRSSGRIPAPTWLRAEPVAAAVTESKYRAGMRVMHPSWGEGMVLDSRLQDDDETVDVVFESVGIKRLAASLAKLSVLKSEK
jgi:DNA helicase-2/ATP-dependent DNA helicase PcrA